MKTKFRKILLIAAVVTLLSVIFCFSASAKDIDAGGSCGDDVHWTYHASTKTLVISGTGEMSDYRLDYLDENVSISPLAHTEMESLVIEKGVTRLGNFAFMGSANLTKVTLPEGLTEIGAGDFRSCTKLEEIDIPNSTTTIGGRAFEKCDSLKKVLFGANITTIDQGAFYSCISLKEIDIPVTVTSLGHRAFTNCTSLKSVTIGRGVTTLSYGTFAWCTSLENVTIYSTITKMEATVFYATPWLEKQPDGVVYVGKCAYIYNGKMPSDGKVTIKDGTTYLVPGVFYKQSDLKTLVIPASVTFIGYDSFVGCDSLKAVYYKGTKAQWNAIDIATIGNSKLTNAKIYYGDTPVTQPTTPPTTQPTTKPQEPTTQPTTKPQEPTTQPTTKPQEPTTQPTTKPQEPTTQPTTKPATKPENEGTDDGKVHSLKAKTVKTTSVTISWKKVAGADEYEICCFDENDNVIVKTTKKTSYTIKKLSSGKEYNISVYAMKDGETIAYGNSIDVTTKVSAPALKSVKSVKAKQATVTWKQVKNASGYVVEYSTSKKFTKKTTKTVKIKKGKTVKAPLKKLKSGKKYYVRIKAYKTVNKKAVYGSYSKIKTVKIK